MKKLESAQLEELVGGDQLRDCLLMGVGIIGIGIGIAMTPATGGTIWTALGILGAGTFGGIGLGATAADCLYL